jgi:hypothetical protein
VCKHKNTGHFESHVWVANCRKAQGSIRSGCQLYVGHHADAEMAARAHDLAALKFCPASRTNFPADEYAHLLPTLRAAAPDEWLMFLRKQLRRKHMSEAPAALRVPTAPSSAAALLRVTSPKETKDAARTPRLAARVASAEIGSEQPEGPKDLDEPKAQAQVEGQAASQELQDGREEQNAAAVHPKGRRTSALGSGAKRLLHEECLWVPALAGEADCVMLRDLMG